MNNYQRKLNILHNYNNLLLHIDNLACDYGELFTKATRTASQIHDDVGPANHDNSSKAEAFAILLERKKAELDKAVAKRQRIDKALNRLKPRHKYLVRMVAIEHQSIYRTANELKYNYNYAIGLFHKCIEELRI